MKIKYIDTHAHALPEYYSGNDELLSVIKRAVEHETAIINIGTNIETSRQCLEVIEKFSSIHTFLFAIPGIHPDVVTEMYRTELAEEGVSMPDSLPTKQKDLQESNFRAVVEERIKNDLASLEEMISSSRKSKNSENDNDYENSRKIVGIGECGIDLYRIEDITAFSTENYDIKNEIFELQRQLFRGQIELALKYDLPLMIHARESYAEILSILDENFIGDRAKLRGNIHFFAGSSEEAKMFLDRGFTVSFTGVITFAKVYEEVVKQVPMDRMLSETDSPFVAPVPMRGKTNEPSYVRFVVEKMAQIKEMEPESCRIVLLDNAERLFRLDLNRS